jgi:ABC-2 type transport system ATP-binding protein
MKSKTAAIETRNLSKDFGHRKAVTDLNITIPKGQLFSLLGTNGAGKTTTIKMLCCLIKPTKGSAFVMRYDVTESPIKIKESIGVSPQETAIASHLNTRENLMLLGGVYGLRSELAKKRTEELMQLMELEDRRDQVRKLSGGMQRRLSIAMALMSDPQILFLDEPTLGLDPHARKSVWNYIEKLKGEKTILLTTHYLEEADALADHIAIMDQSKIIASGTSPELKKSHRGLQVLHINAENITKEIIAELKKLGLEVTNDDLGLDISGSDMDVNQVLDLLRSRKLKISGIHLNEPSLEDVFLKLTGKEMHE